MAHLIIIRGIPGSGKSTWAKSFGVPVYEADDWFIGTDGIYQFYPNELKQAHLYCYNRTKQTLLNGLDCVVSNTFIKRWEYEIYTTLCESIGATYEIKVAAGNFKSIHGVPEAVIERMKQSFEI